MELLSFRKLCMEDEGHRIWKYKWTSQCSPLELFWVDVRVKCKGGEKIGVPAWGFWTPQPEEECENFQFLLMAVLAPLHGHLRKDDTHKSTQACFHSFSHGCMEIYAIYFEALWSKQKGVPAALLSQFMNLLLANVQVDFKKCPSKPGFANDLGFSSPKVILKKQTTIESKLTKNSGISIWSPRHRFCSQIAAHETKPPTKAASV